MARVKSYFKRVRGEWKRYRGNPLKKNVALGHFDHHGKFHKHKAIHAYAPRRKRKSSRGRRRR